MGHSFMAGSSNPDVFGSNDGVYDTGSCCNLVKTKDFFTDYTPFSSPKVFKAANGTPVAAHRYGPISVPTAYAQINLPRIKDTQSGLERL